jgi:uncharacterized protein YxjI
VESYIRKAMDHVNDVWRYATANHLFVRKKKKRIVYCDTHYGAPHSHKPVVFEKNAILNGDIFDIKNASFDQLSKIYDHMNYIIDRYGERYNLGNHELMAFFASIVRTNMSVDDWRHSFFIEDGILYSHGDIFKRGFEPAMKWRLDRSPGATDTKRCLVKTGAIFREMKMYSRISNSVARRAVMWAKHFDCHTVMWGHTHPVKQLEKVVDGIRLINLMRGRSEVWA